MKKLRRLTVVFTALLCYTGVATALPDKEFVCRVQTTSVKIGAVWVQAYDLASAEEIALNSPALTMEANSEAVQLVLECLRFPGGRFSDPAFQAFLENIPR